MPNERMQGHFTICNQEYHPRKPLHTSNWDVPPLIFSKCIRHASFREALQRCVRVGFWCLLERCVANSSDDDDSRLWWYVSKILWRQSSRNDNLYLGYLHHFILHCDPYKLLDFHPILEQSLSVALETLLERSNSKGISQSSGDFIQAQAFIEEGGYLWC